MISIHKIVLPDGRLDERGIAKKETLYKGMNGSCVERLYAASGRSYVLKRLAREDRGEPEAMVYEKVLPQLPSVYPRLLASSASGDPAHPWLLFEDAGPLRHRFGQDIAMRVIERMACWQALPTDDWADLPLKGPKPSIEAIAAQLAARLPEVQAVLERLDSPGTAAAQIYGVLEQLPAAGPPHRILRHRPVLSHGDLHTGNYAFSGGGLVVLDWEHAHLNSPLWDLYHLLDLSHPLFPKQMTPAMRIRLLRYFAECSQPYGKQYNLPELLEDYGLFASIFSLWLLLLIEADLVRPDEPWPYDKLLLQQRETMESLRQCLELLDMGKSGPGREGQ